MFITNPNDKSKISNSTKFFYLLIFLSFNADVNAKPFSFIDSGQRLGVIRNGVATIAYRDINNDGFVDLVLASPENKTIIQLYLNDGNGNFTKTNDIFPVTENPNFLWNFGIALADFNADGLIDIATADAWRGTNIYLNNENSGFLWSQAILVPEVNEVKGIDAADIDHNGSVDLVFGGHNGLPDRGDRIYLNNGSGYFTDSGQQIGSDVTWKTIFGDLNNDGSVDYVSINRYRVDSAKIHINNSEGLFSEMLDISTTETDDSYDVKISDLNNDAYLDIVIANSFDPQNGTTNKVYLNQGNFNFILINNRLGGTNYEAKDIAIIDIDNDGFKDIVLGNHNTANTIFINDGTGNFTKAEVEIPSYETHAIAACDVNNDGLVDIITGDATDGYYKVYLQIKETKLTKNDISQLYVSIFNRTSEGEGNTYWRSQPDMATAASIMIDTDAAKNYFGSSLDTNQAFIEHIYRNTLDKTLFDDSEGIAYWVGLLDSGTSRGTVVATLVGVIKDYGPGGQYYNPSDVVTVAAYNRFTNRVLVSDYMADNVQDTPEGWETVTSFSSGLIVTDDPATVIIAKAAVDAF